MKILFACLVAVVFILGAVAFIEPAPAIAGDPAQNLGYGIGNAATGWTALIADPINAGMFNGWWTEAFFKALFITGPGNAVARTVTGAVEVPGIFLLRGDRPYENLAWEHRE